MKANHINNIKLSGTDLYDRTRKPTNRYLIKVKTEQNIVLGTAKKEKHENGEEYFSFMPDIK